MVEKLQCDLVMRGGITSGIVYPRAIAKLAETYRFRSIGGTSAGARDAKMRSLIDQKVMLASVKRTAPKIVEVADAAACVAAAEDDHRSMEGLIRVLTARYEGDAFKRILFTECPDKVASGMPRLPTEICPDDPESWWSRKSE